MATLTGGFSTFADVMARLDPGGSLMQIAELLTKKLPLLQDMPMVPGNTETGHRVAARTGLPSPTWRRFNQGINGSVSSVGTFDEVAGMLEDYSKVDVDLAELGGDPAAYRASEDMAFLEAFKQEIATGVFYHSAVTNPERFHGLSARYGGTSGFTASSYVTKGTNSGTDCQSVWLINWSPGKIYSFYPKNSMGGFRNEDLGKQLVLDSSNRTFHAWVTKFQWKFGLVVEDYRYAHRHQWDPGDTTPYADTARGLYLAMQNMMTNVYDLEAGRARFYMNRTSAAKLMAQLASNDANFLTYAKAPGNEATNDGLLIPHFLGVPIRITDALVQESAIS